MTFVGVKPDGRGVAQISGTGGFGTQSVCSGPGCDERPVAFCPRHTPEWGYGCNSSPATRTRVHPDRSGRLPLQGRGGKGHIRGQGQEPQVPPGVLLPGFRRAASAYTADGLHSCRCGLDRGGQRGRGTAAGVLLDQAVRPAVQRQVPRRQKLSLPRHHPQRGVSTCAGHARRQTQGGALLRSLFPRLGHSGDRRSAPSGVSGAHLLGRGLSKCAQQWPSLPARLHRQVRGTVCGQGEPGRASEFGGGLLFLPGR